MEIQLPRPTTVTCRSSETFSHTGATLVEYALILAIMALVILALSSTAGTSASKHYQDKSPGINQAYPSGFVTNPTPTAN
jgi:Flp pilus assembly pilin Flp